MQMKFSLLRRLIGARDGSVIVLFAVAAPVIALLVGMAIDYSMAASQRDQLDSIADAAALAAVTPQMLTQADSISQQTAQTTFTAQAAAVGSVSSPSATITVQDNGPQRTVTVSYTATYNTIFAKLLGVKTIPLGGSSTATATGLPNINFYLLLDSSPSMGLPATASGISTLESNTTQQEGGCAFACHESNPTTSDNAGNPGGVKGNGSFDYNCYPTNTKAHNPCWDNYTLAKTGLNLTLRIDMLRTAVQDLMTQATSLEAENNNSVKYEAAVYSFDALFHTIQTMTSDLSSVSNAMPNFQMQPVYNNNTLMAADQNGNWLWGQQGAGNSDEDTDFDNALANINRQMATPGNGGNGAGDTPQEVLLIVTDGVEDENVTGYVPPPPINNDGENASVGRYQSPMQYNITNGGHSNYASITGGVYYSPTNLLNPVTCQTIKNRGIRIGILYLTYLPLGSEKWYADWVKDFQPDIGSYLQACASPGLYSQVSDDSQIPAALQALFNQAVQTARLVK
jgi:Flp pilus assembly protein TadG